MESRKAFSQLTYQLIYPAILGSIIFDLFDPFRSFTTVRVVSLLIGILFVVDYLHMTLNLCKDGTSELKYGALADMVIAFLLCWSYFALAKTTGDKFTGHSVDYYKISLGLVLVANFFILLYEKFLDKELFFINIIPMFFSIIGFFALFLFSSSYALAILIVSMFLIVTSYTYRVIKIYPENKKGRV
jgi:hypothetical protein